MTQRASVRSPRSSRIADLGSTGVVVLFSALVSMPLFSPRITQGSDAAFHLYRYFGTVSAWRAGQIVPQVDPLVLEGFGHAPNLFYSPLTAWVVGAVYMLTSSWPWSVNLVLAASFVASAVTMHLFVREITASNLSAIIASALYVAAPYHLTEIWSRQAHGEVVAFAFTPLVFHGLWRLLWPNGAGQRYWVGGILRLSAGMAGLVLTHALSAEMVAAGGLAIVALNLRRLRWRFWAASASAAIVAGSIAAIFLLPLLGLSRSGLYNVFWPGSAFNQHYPDHAGDRTLNLGEMLGAGVWNVSAVAVKVPVSATIGFALGVGVILTIVAAWGLSLVDRRIVIQFGALGLAALVLASNLVDWNYVPKVLWSIQFPFRLLMLASFALSVSVGVGVASLIRSVVRRTHRQQEWKATAAGAVIALVFVAVSGPWLGWWSRPTVDPAALSNHLPAARLAVAYAEYLPLRLGDTSTAMKWLARRGTAPMVQGGAAEVVDASHDEAVAAAAHISTARGASIEFAKIFYPGYRATLERPDGTVLPVRVSHSKHGLVLVVLPAGCEGTVVLTYGATRLTVAGMVITGLGCAIWLCLAAAVLLSAGHPIGRELSGAAAALIGLLRRAGARVARLATAKQTGHR